MAIDKSKLSRLPPEERLKMLKGMEKKRKKEVGEIESLIKQSMKDLKTDKLASKIAPEQREVDISQLFEKERGDELEMAARQEMPKQAAAGAGNYHVIAQLYQDYSQLKEFYGMLSSGNGLSQQQLSAIGKIGERMHAVEKYMTEGEKTTNILNPSRSIFYKLKKETGLD